MNADIHGEVAFGGLIAGHRRLVSILADAVANRSIEDQKKLY